MSTVTIDTEWVRRKVDYKFGDETAFDVDEIISECVVAPVAPDPGLPDVPNLAHIARYLAEHPETVAALEGLGNWMTQDKSWPALYGLIAAMRGEGGHE